MSVPDPAPTVTFPTWARLALGLLIAGLGYLVGGELHVSEELRGALSALTLLLASAGVVPPSPSDFKLSPGLRYALTALVTAGAYAVSVIPTWDLTVRGIIIAVLSLAASIGIVPPQAK